MLLPVALDKDDALFGGVGAKINKQQQFDMALISGRSYYHLKCTVWCHRRAVL